MPAQEDDFILLQIEILGRIIARLMGRRDPGEEEFALLQVFDLQEKLFGMPAATFLKLSPADQVAALVRGESKAIGRERCRSYVVLLMDTASLYQLRGEGDLAFGARQLALYVALLAVSGEPDDPAADLVRKLQALMAGSPLSPPIQGLLDEFEQPGGGIPAARRRPAPESSEPGSAVLGSGANPPKARRGSVSSVRYDPTPHAVPPVRAHPFTPWWKLSLGIAAVFSAFVAYSCLLPTEKLVGRQRSYGRWVVIVHEAFGENAKAAAPIAAGASVACIVVLAVTAKRGET